VIRFGIAVLPLALLVAPPAPAEATVQSPDSGREEWRDGDVSTPENGFFGIDINEVMTFPDSEPFAAQEIRLYGNGPLVVREEPGGAELLSVPRTAVIDWHGAFVLSTTNAIRVIKGDARRLFEVERILHRPIRQPRLQRPLSGPPEWSDADPTTPSSPDGFFGIDMNLALDFSPAVFQSQTVTIDSTGSVVVQGIGPDPTEGITIAPGPTREVRSFTTTAPDNTWQVIKGDNGRLWEIQRTLEAAPAQVPALQGWALLALGVVVGAISAYAARRASATSIRRTRSAGMRPETTPTAASAKAVTASPVADTIGTGNIPEGASRSSDWQTARPSATPDTDATPDTRTDSSAPCSISVRLRAPIALAIAISTSRSASRARW
jgi:hypothetical protein